ncbi:MAG: hypothetical protein SYC29_06675 [Planctomycetota bacterium]|nr:hypothetical protein [Planctomycetota bacterium]
MPRPLLPLPNRPFASFAFLTILIGFVCLPSPTACGQGMNGMLPDPIADQDLSAYAHRLGLSEDQRLAVDAYHARYLEEFRRLREAELDPFLEESAGILRRFMFGADSREAKRSLNELDRLISRIKSLDDGLFNQIQTVLSEDQTQAMPGVRQMRQRERYRSGLVRFVGYANPGARIDLARFIELIELAPNEREKLAPAVSGYEDQLTGSLRNLYRATRNMYLNMIEELEKLNPGGDPRANMYRFRGQLRDILAEAGADVMAEASRTSALNLRFFRQFATVLPDDAAERLRAEYYRQAYPDVHRGMTECLAQYDAALSLPDLSRKQHEAIESARQVLEDRHERLARQMIDAWEDVRKSGTFFGRRSRSDNDARERLEKLQEERDALNERARESLLALLGTDLAEDLHRARAEPSDDAGPALSTTTGGMTTTRRRAPAGPRPGSAPTDDEAPARPGAAGPDPYLPPPISAFEAERIAAWLDLEDDQETILNVLHNDYRDSFEELREQLIAPILDLTKNMWVLDPVNEDVQPPSADVIDRLFNLRREAFDGILALDESFFDNVDLALVDDDDASSVTALRRLRLMRQRAAYNRDAARVGTGFRRQGNRMFFGRSTPDHLEFRIDLTALVDGQHLDHEDRTALEPVLMDYEQAAVEAFRQRFELALEYGRGTERLSAAIATQRRESGGRFDRSIAEEFRRLRDTLGRQLREAEAAITELNRRTLREIMDRLPTGAASSVHTAYRRQAFPGVYEDPTAAEGHFVAALALPDLSSSQRTRINDILVEYRGAYADLCEQMADLQAEEARQSGPDVDRGPDYWQKRRDRRTRLERLRFDRNDLNEKALRQLRAALGEDQLQRLGLVEEE